MRLSAELQAVSSIFIPKLQEYLRSEFETKIKAKANAELSLNCAVQGTFPKSEIRKIFFFFSFFCSCKK